MAYPHDRPARRPAHGLARLALVACLLALTQGMGTGGLSADTPECRIDRQSSGANITVIGAIQTNAPLSGRYRLEVTTNSAGGTSRVVQQGEFQAHPDRPEPLGRVMTRIGAGGGSASNFR